MQRDSQHSHDPQRCPDCSEAVLRLARAMATDAELTLSVLAELPSRDRELISEAIIETGTDIAIEQLLGPEG